MKKSPDRVSGENDRDIWFRWRDGIMIVNLIHESGNGNALRPRRPTPFPLLEKGAKEHFLHGTRQGVEGLRPRAFLLVRFLCVEQRK